MAKKNQDIIDAASEIVDAQLDQSQTFNPLLVALHNNDKKNLFKTNVTTAFIKTGFPLFDYYFGSVVNIHDELGRLIGQEPRVGQAVGTFNLLIGNSGSGKALPNSMRIPCPSGWIKMGDIRVGDYVFDADGKSTLVSGVYPQGVRDICQINFSDGRVVECSEDHLWEVFDVHGNGEPEVLSTADIRDTMKSNPNVEYAVHKLSKPVEYDESPVPVDPYLYGVALSSCISLKPFRIFALSTNDYSDLVTNIGTIMDAEEVIKEATAIFIKDGKTLTAEDIFGDGYEEFFSGAIKAEYLHNSYDVRMELLRGMMDGYGIFENRNNIIEYHCGDHRTAIDFVSLIESLGYYASIKPYSSLGRTAYNIELDIPDDFAKEIFVIPKKSKDLSKFHNANYKSYITIKDIINLTSEECTCIYVENDRHLFLTENFIPTHNTTLGAQIAANIIRQYTYANAIHFDCEQRFDTSRCETITKLPSSFFDTVKGERYLIKSGSFGLDTIQEMIVKMYVQKMKLKDQLTVPSGFKDEFGRDVMILQPTVIIIDSITTVLNETFNPDSAKEASEAEGLRTNTEGARDAKTLKGFFKDIIPLCKEANIIVYGINHINSNMSMNSFLPVAKQQNYLKQDESIPGGRTMIYYPFNIVKLTAKPSDDFTEEGDGFAGHMVMVEPIKSSSNQSGNNSKGISFELVFSHKEGFDNLRSMVMYGRDHGLIEGNKARLKFRDDPDCTFTWRNLEREKDEKPIYENIKKYIVPTLNQHLPFIEPTTSGFDSRSLDY